MYGYVLVLRHMWRAEDNLSGLVLSFYCVGPRVQTQVVRLGGKHLYPLSSVSCPRGNLLSQDVSTISTCKTSVCQLKFINLNSNAQSLRRSQQPYQILNMAGNTGTLSSEGWQPRDLKATGKCWRAGPLGTSSFQFLVFSYAILFRKQG